MLPIHGQTRFVIVGPHYPENVGAAARALKTMGFAELWLVRPGRLAHPTHELARKMAVKALDVLERTRVAETVEEAVGDAGLVLATTARRGISLVIDARQASRLAVRAARDGERVAVLLGNEKTGLGRDALALAHERVRVPLAGDQPSLNLAQAVQVLAYELMVSALEARDARA